MTAAFGSLVLLSALATAVARTHRAGVIWLWATGLASGALSLSLGFELLGVLQWLVSTLGALCSLFFLVAFDEDENRDPRPRKERILAFVPPLLASLAFGGSLVLALLPLLKGKAGFLEAGSSDSVAALGSALVERHVISAELVALTLFVCLVGGGMLVRPLLKPKGDT